MFNVTIFISKLILHKFYLHSILDYRATHNMMYIHCLIYYFSLRFRFSLTGCKEYYYE
jgi:hypothetical protein